MATKSLENNCMVFFINKMLHTIDYTDLYGICTMCIIMYYMYIYNVHILSLIYIIITFYHGESANLRYVLKKIFVSWFVQFTIVIAKY